MNVPDAITPGINAENTSLPAATDFKRDHRESAAVTDLAHAALRILAGETSTRRRNAPKITDHCVNAFCSLLLSGRMRPALNLTRMFARRGADYKDIAEDLFGAAAQRMGDRWATDKASMLDVNIGSSTLLRTHIAFRSSLKEPPATLEASATFASFSGQSHIIGLSFAAEYFRRNGWNMHYMPGANPDAFLTAVSAETPDIVGLTAASDSDLEILQGVMHRLRQLRFPPRIVVGGSSPNLGCLNADAVVAGLDMGLLAGHRLLG